MKASACSPPAARASTPVLQGDSNDIRPAMPRSSRRRGRIRSEVKRGSAGAEISDVPRSSQAE
ncbi:hypothetical protein RMP42_05839 [Roseomonas mucosa]|nr:hypothetical protein RMP42_05839 [Roseomonas mucosa]